MGADPKERKTYPFGECSFESTPIRAAKRLLVQPFGQLGGRPEAGARWKLMIIRNARKGSRYSSCGWPVNAHRDFSAAATLVF